jgi:hypothetical protein
MLVRRVLRTVAAAGAAGGMMVGAAAAAGSAEPVVQACVGDSLSELASNQEDPGGFGAGVVAFAQQPDGSPGVGDGIQLLQEGLVPDVAVPNTCNDG